MYIVLDLEFYHNSKKEQLGPIKQLGAFKFDADYQIVDVFEMTVTKYTTERMLKQLFNQFIKGVDTMYVWAKNNDLKAMTNVLEAEALEMDVIDVQEYFKDVNLASLSTISEALLFDSEGRHNALIDAEYTFEIIKHFNLNSEVSRNTISNYVNLIRSSESIQKKGNHGTKFETKNDMSKYDYRIVSPGSMRKLNEEYYQIVSETVITQIITNIKERNLPICKDGKFNLELDLEKLVQDKASIVFTNTSKFKEVSKKHEDKLIIVVDEMSENTYLAVFISKKVYKKFIK